MTEDSRVEEAPRQIELQRTLDALEQAVDARRQDEIQRLLAQAEASPALYNPRLNALNTSIAAQRPQ